MLYAVNLPRGSPKTAVSDKNWLAEITYGKGYVDLVGFPDEILEALFDEWPDLQVELGTTPRIYGEPVITIQLHYTRSPTTVFAGEIIIISPQGLILYHNTLPGILGKGQPLLKALSRLALPLLTLYKTLNLAPEDAPVLTPITDKIIDEITNLPGIELLIDLKTGKKQEYVIRTEEAKNGDTLTIKYTLQKLKTPIATAEITIQPTRRPGRVLMSIMLNGEVVEEVLITHDEKLLPIAGVANAIEGEIIPQTKELIKQAPREIKQSDEWTFAKWLGDNLVRTLFKEIEEKNKKSST